MDEHCYVYGTLPATPGCEDQHALGLIAHMDTADDASGENVQPVVWENYNGGDVTLPATGMVMKTLCVPLPYFHEGRDPHHLRRYHPAGCRR